MATKQHIQATDRSRVRFMLVDFDGASADLHQLAQTFAYAVKIPQQNPAALPNPAHVGVATSVQELPQTQGNGEAPVSESDHGDAAEFHVEPLPVSKAPNGAKKKFKTPSIIPGLDLSRGPKPFKDYVQEQAPAEHSKRYLVCMQWLKEFHNTEEVGADHIYTCYRGINLNVPRDVLSVLRSLKKQGWAENGSKRGFFKINHIGEAQLKCAPA